LNLLDYKLDQFTEEDLNNLILHYQGAEFCYPDSSIKKMWRNWLRNKKDERNFDVVFAEKYKSRFRKYKRNEQNFVPYQVGFLTINYDEPSYSVHLIGEPKYKVLWENDVQDKLAKMDQSLKNFCEAQSVRLLKSGTPNTLVIETVFTG